MMIYINNIGHTISEPENNYNSNILLISNDVIDIPTIIILL